MNCLMHFAASSNGDNWFLGTDDITNKDFVLHRGNPSSGGHETISAVQVFLDKRPFGPERDALLAMLDGEKLTAFLAKIADLDATSIIQFTNARRIQVQVIKSMVEIEKNAQCALQAERAEMYGITP